MPPPPPEANAPAVHCAPDAPTARRHPLDAAARAYAHNLLTGTALRYLPPKLWQRRGSGALKLIQAVLASTSSASSKGEANNCVQKTDRKALRRLLARHARASGAAPKPSLAPLPEPLQRNLDLCASLLHLDPAELALVRLALVVSSHRRLRALFACFKKANPRSLAQAVAAATGAPTQTVLGHLDRAGRLRQMKLFGRSYEGMTGPDLFELSSLFLQVLSSPTLDRGELIETFVPRSPPPDLAWPVLAEAHSAAKHVLTLLAQALAQKVAGINVLFYGDTGTGKTALARALAHKLEAPLYMADFTDRYGTSLSGAERMASYALAQRLIAPGTGLMLFDEFDEVLSGHTDGTDQGSPSKNWLNTLLETNPTPAVFIANDISEVDAAHLRRFAFVVEFRPASQEVRQRAVAQYLDGPDELSAADISALCEAYPLDPGHLALAMRTCRLMAGRAHLPTLKHILAPPSRLGALSRRAAPPTRPKAYDLGLVACSVDLQALTRDLVAAASAGPLLAGLLVYGPPGTGKSAYLQHLAHELDRPVVYRTAAGLLGRLVGDTEKAIHRAFQEAQETDAVLIFDEVESLLPQRSSDLHGWETTCVTTFLQELEHFKGTVGCTTNHLEHLDAAALRRFTFKMKMDYPSLAQRLALFDQFLFPHLEGPWTAAEQDSVRDRLAGLPPVTVGDFKVVAQQQALRGRRSSVTDLFVALMAEAGHRRPVLAPMGFAQGR